MSQAVVIKSNKYGIRLVLDGEMPFEALLLAVKDKFAEAGGFFKNASLALSFEGRELSLKEQEDIIDVITKNSDIKIVCVADEDASRQELYKRSIEAAADAAFKDPGDTRTLMTGQSSFYEGTLRSGQLLECETGVVILGDVNPGARIVSRGNIVVLGALKGTAFAGSSGDKNCFIAALEMDPIQIQIADVLAKSPDKDKKGKPKKLSRKSSSEKEIPMMAVSRNGNIYIEPIRKNV